MPTRFRLPRNTKRTGNKSPPYPPLQSDQTAALPATPIRVGWAFMPTRFRLPRNTERTGSKYPPHLATSKPHIKKPCPVSPPTKP